MASLSLHPVHVSIVPVEGRGITEGVLRSRHDTHYPPGDVVTSRYVARNRVLSLDILIAPPLIDGQAITIIDFAREMGYRIYSTFLFSLYLVWSSRFDCDKRRIDTFPSMSNVRVYTLGLNLKSE